MRRDDVHHPIFVDANDLQLHPMVGMQRIVDSDESNFVSSMCPPCPGFGSATSHRRFLP
jgi:hypothetical protein